MIRRSGWIALLVFGLLVSAYFIAAKSDLLGIISLPFITIYSMLMSIILFLPVCKMVSLDLIDCNPTAMLGLYLMISLILSTGVYLIAKKME